MNSNETMQISERTFALTAGISILAMALLAGFAYGFVFPSLVVAGDAHATASNIQHSEMLFRAGIASFVLVIVCDVLAAWGVFHVLQRVNRSLSLLAAWFRLVFAAMFGAALSSFVVALHLARGAQYLKALKLSGADASDALVLLCVSAFNDIWSLGLVFFAVHLFLVGYLALKAGFIPKFIGILAVAASLCYMATSGANILMPNYAAYKPTVELVLTAPMALGELGVGLWLLIKGGKQG